MFQLTNVIPEQIIFISRGITVFDSCVNQAHSTGKKLFTCQG